MKYLAQSLALLGALTLTLPAPAQASDESPQAVEKAFDVAQDAREDLFDTFDKDTLRDGQFVWRVGANTAGACFGCRGGGGTGLGSALAFLRKNIATPAHTLRQCSDQTRLWLLPR